MQRTQHFVATRYTMRQLTLKVLGR